MERPKNIHELKYLINLATLDEGWYCSLNHIDTSLIDNMSLLFANSRFKGDISQWNVSRVKRMDFMFRGTEFNGDLSQWDVSNVEDMSYMFADSEFRQDISKWNVSKVEHIENMFQESVFGGDVHLWTPVKPSVPFISRRFLGYPTPSKMLTFGEYKEKCERRKLLEKIPFTEIQKPRAL